MSLSLLNINVDALFEQHNVAEIDQIQKKLQTEVERKREDLRTMVGERYRDLLKAADTIATMKDTSSSVIEEIEIITTNCRSLNERQLIGFKTHPQYLSLPNRQLNIYFSTVVQIKLLTNLPEMIWTQIDNEKFSIATQLFILSRHISTGLQLDVNSSLMQHFPVAKKYWSILNPFFFTIKQNCLTVLERENLTSEAAADCLLSLFLLDKCSFDVILNTFVQLRGKAFLSALTNEYAGQRRVKERILSSLKVLNSTVALIYDCFIGNETSKAVIIEELEKISNSNAPPTISLMNLDDSDLVQTLPDIIAKFKPTFEATSLSSDTLKSALGKWLDNISKVASVQLKHLFELVSSMKTIQEIKKESQSTEKSINWNEMCEKLFLPVTLDFYQFKYQPLINERIRDIIQHSWLTSLSETVDDISKLLKISDKNDLLNLWAEDEADIPSGLKEASQQDKKLNRLLMKSKGYSQEIVEICTKFDNRLGTIFSEINVVLNENDGKIEEKQILIDFLKDISQEQISNLITEIKSFNYERNNENIILLARVLISLIEMCPNLKLCLSHTYMASSWDQISNDTRIFDKWNRVCSLLEEESFILWKQFCEVFLKDYTIKDFMNESIGYDAILKDFVNWDTITIEENDEQDNPIQSTIKIPSQTRISLQIYLFKLIDSLNHYVPQTLPRKVLQYLVGHLIETLLQLYKNLINNEFITSNQNISLQLYFDLKFLQLLFVARDDKRIQDEFQKLTNTLKNNVDPFDFELFHSYLNNNVKKCAQRMRHELGVLLPFPENIGILAEMKQLGQDRDPNVLCLCSNGASSAWFPLLPIIVPGNKTTAPRMIDSEKISLMKPKKPDTIKLTTAQQAAQNYASNVKSGAAAFFGAMSQDWFK